MKTAVVIVAAGRGQRLNTADTGNAPKQYLPLGGISVLQRTANCFLGHPDIEKVQIVIHADDMALYEEHVEPHSKLLSPVIGGATRQESCKSGIDAVHAENMECVLIHDAARPFVSKELVSRVIAGIDHNQGSLPACAIADTIKRADADLLVEDTLARDGLYQAQTPQGFFTSEVFAAHEKAKTENRNDFTDDAAVVEWCGMKIKLVEGERSNFKITTSDDLKMAIKQIQTNAMADIRTGSGYDVHTLVPGEFVMLCGLEIKHNKKLDGHSDADVGLHALTDALLGTIGAGDIGSHFPPSDAKWKGASSDRFIAHAIELVQAQGGAIMNLDVTIICEAPKIGPHREDMRQKISDITGVQLKRISVKATTNEKIGFIGREEGIAAIASASVNFGVIENV